MTYASSSSIFGLVIIGGGPAGIATLLAAHYSGDLKALLEDGVLIVEKTSDVGSGSIGSYGINSDSSGATFVDCLRSAIPTDLTRLYDTPLAKQLLAKGDGAVPLSDVGAFLRTVGSVLGEMISASGGEILTKHEALEIKRKDDIWLVEVVDPSGRTRIIKARNVVLATGAEQPVARLDEETVSGISLSESCRGRLVQSDEVLKSGGLRMIADRLSRSHDPRVVVVGGSTSAAAVCRALLHDLPELQFSKGGVTLLHNRPLRLYYPSISAAREDAYADFTLQDLCPISGKLYRFAGFRLDSRELVMQLLGIGGRAPEPRLTSILLDQSSQATARRLLADADLVVPALGYRPNALRVSDSCGVPIKLFASTGNRRPLVDLRCRVLDDGGEPLPNLFGIGLAAGFVPSGSLGGEPSFRGQANGLWLWQKDVGQLIVDALKETLCIEGARPRVHAGGQEVMEGSRA